MDGGRIKRIGHGAAGRTRWKVKRPRAEPMQSEEARTQGLLLDEGRQALGLAMG